MLIYFCPLLIPVLPVQFYEIDYVNVLQLFIMRFHWKSSINIISNLKKKKIQGKMIFFFSFIKYVFNICMFLFKYKCIKCKYRISLRVDFYYSFY